MTYSNNIGVIGRGFVGTAVSKGFAQFAELKIYDVDPKKASHSFGEVVNCDFVFLCLPTPMIDAKGGRADLAILEKCFTDIFAVEDRNKDAIFVIKSTVPIGTTQRLCLEHDTNRIVHCPEFLTARSALIDFICPARNIVGYENSSVGEEVKKLMEDRFPGTPCFVMRSKESETVKYMANCFFATKVMFFNEMALLIDEMGLSWDRIIEGVMSDGRIGTSHYQVPGHDGDRGFGGTCVLPDAEVKGCLSYTWSPAFATEESKSRVEKCMAQTFNGRISIEELYERFKNKSEDNIHPIFVESCDAKLEEVMLKEVKDMTCREIDEEIYCFETDEGLFECTGDHLMPVLVNDVDLFIIKAKEIESKYMLFVKKEDSFDFLKINKIEKRPYVGKVYNLELESHVIDDDLFWVEQRTGIVTHNCFPKDINALITVMEKNGVDPLVLKAVWEQNTKIRKNWDWAKNSSAVSNIEEL